MSDLIDRLRHYETPEGGATIHPICDEAADTIERLSETAVQANRYFLAEAEKVERLTAYVVALKTVMVAAAEEIHTHWQAHCDAEGYGPQNLMRRLEEGIPSEYGYTAGAFAKLTAEVAAQAAAIGRHRDTCQAWAYEYEKLQAEVAALREDAERVRADISALHMAQATNNQNHPAAWHDAVDAALEAIDAARKEQP